MIGKKIDALAGYLCIIALFVMLALSALGIVLRWSGLSLLWVDPLIRHLVIVTAFAGGVLAVGKNSHIKIDVLSKPMERAPLVWRRRVDRILSLLTALVTLGLVWSAWQFFIMEREFGSPALLNLHSSMLVLIFPIGWGALALRWFVSFAESFKKVY